MTVTLLTIQLDSDDCYDNTVNLSWDSGAIAQGFTGSNPLVGGMRWPSAAIPQGALITSATLTLKTRGAASGTSWGNWYGVAADNPATFSAANKPSAQPRTLASVPVKAGADATSFSHDVTAIIQEIVSRPNWVSGNALALVGGDSAGASGLAIFADLQNGGYASPLIISFVAGNPASTGRGSVLRSNLGRRRFAPIQAGLALASRRDMEGAARRSLLNWLLDRVIYRGAAKRTGLYLGTRTDDQLYRGERDLI